MADCDLPGIQPLLAVFDAALEPIQPYLDFAFNQPALTAKVITRITGELLAPPALPGIIAALQIVDVTAALGDLPAMPALGPFPELGFGPLSVDGTINLNWAPVPLPPNAPGLQLITVVVAMIGIPVDLIVGTLLGDLPAFPDIIIESLPDFPGAVALAECIEEKLPMF
jgi:hypothetical protein